MQLLANIRIRNFRSVQSVEIDAMNLTAFLGANGLQIRHRGRDRFQVRRSVLYFESNGRATQCGKTWLRRRFLFADQARTTSRHLMWMSRALLHAFSS